MADAEVLSQEEIDALLKGVEEGDIDLSADSGQAKVKAYDFSSQDRIVRGRMPTLDMINEKFSRGFRVDMFNLLRRDVELTVNNLSMMKYSDYIGSMTTPTSINVVKMPPLRGVALFVFQPELVFSLVDSFFGGQGGFNSTIKDREFTPTEVRIIEKLLEIIFKNYQQAWQSVIPIALQLDSMEANPRMANFLSPIDVLVLNNFHIGLENSGGAFQIVLPYNMLEPVRELMGSVVKTDGAEEDDRWTTSLQEEVMDVAVGVSSALAQVNVSLKDIVGLKKGDVIPIELPDAVTLCAEEVPMFKAKFGVSDGYMALKITDRAESKGA